MLNQVSQGLCSIEQVVEWMCAGPAKIWNIKNKGQIKVGFDADLTLVDLNLSQTIRNKDQQTKCGWSPWDGEALTGWPVGTWVMGEQVFSLENGNPQFNSEFQGREIEYG